MSERWGVTVNGNGQWTAALWSPSAHSVAVMVDGRGHVLAPVGGGWWRGELTAPAGSSYYFVVNDIRVPDPASRRQAGDVHGDSVLVDHNDFNWQTPWRGREWPEAVIYELHIGTFTPEGTFDAAREKLDELASLGITAIEIMPVGQWSGERGWGYDSILPFAPHQAYGTPEQFKALIDHAHGLGMMVLLDIVMNHFGPEGAYIHSITPEFFAPERHTPWGAAIHFDVAAVRYFWIQCASMWITDYKLDGLRLDAVHEISGPGADQFLQEYAETLREQHPERRIHLITEDDRNSPKWRENGLYDASWNDDFHHAIHTALTGESHHYYASYAVNPIDDLCRALQHGQVEEGQERPGRQTPRGQSSGHLQPTAFVNAIQTHDQIGNRAHGDRLITLADPAAVEVAYALLLACPYVPMIVMGEERGETAPFLYFADYEGDLADAIRAGRIAEFEGIAAIEGPVPDALALETFLASKLSWHDDERARRWLDLTRQCLAFRHNHVVPLLKSGRVGSAEVRRVGTASIQAHWEFAAGDLDIALNFGAPGGLQQPEVPHLMLNNLERDDFAISVQGRIA